MTKAELIRKLARKTGVPDSEAKIFFEIFLQQLSSLLAPGEAVNISGLGFFQLRKGKIKDANKPAGVNNKTDVYSDLIVHTPSPKDQDNAEMLIFNVPAAKAVQYNVIDSYFSLSAGKPVIPLRGVKNTEFFIPPTGSELRRLLETKVENLLSQSEVEKKYAKGNEFLFISPESFKADQFEINWGEPFGQKEADAIELESIPWDFGSDISRQIEEESILDIERDEGANPKENVSWDFGSEYIEDINTPAAFTPEEPLKFHAEPEEPGHNIQPKNFKRVKSFTKEHKKSPGLITRSEENLSWGFGETGKSTGSSDDQFYKKHYAEPVTDEKGFTEVINKRKTYDIELSSRDQARLDSIINEELHKGEDIETGDLTEGFYKDETKPQPKKEVSTKTYTKDYYSRRSSTPIFIIALLVIVGVGAALFFYLKNNTSLNKNLGQPEIAAGSTAAPVIIDRTYDVPVSYPYGQNESIEAVNLPPAEKKNEPVPVQDPPVVKATQPTATPSSIREPVPGAVKIKNNIFKDGDTYSVQVSSWQSKAKAEKEAQKLIGKGFKAFVERAEVPGKGTWYRVKVGNFKTQAEAEKYINN